MKSFCSFLLTIIVSLNTYCQHFEGEIIYQNKYKSKIPNLTDEKFTALMGTTQDYFIKGAEYKSVTNGTLLQWQIYVPAENRLFTKMSNNEAALWTDAGINPDSVISVVLNKNTGEVLGYSCDELILNCKSGIQKFYFSPKLSLDSKMYLKHKYGNWWAFVSKSNALPLKIEIENSQFSMTSTAVEIKPGKLEDGLFLLPPGINTDKSPY